MIPLPIDPCLPDLLSCLREHGAAVLKAPPGSGKTTRVPPAILASNLLAPTRNVLVLEPRRVAARAAAARISSELGTKLGALVGYQVRGDQKRSASTRILFVTEGILLRRLQADPFLNDVGAVVFDEFHERRLDSDLAFSMVQRVRSSVRDDLKLLVMSATMELAGLTRYLRLPFPIVGESSAYPVSIEYLGDESQPLKNRVARGALRALHEQQGDVLVFLPGKAEISAVRSLLESEGDGVPAQVHELYGGMRLEEQASALEASRCRRIILATNVAETSVTVDGVGSVVDSGLARSMHFDSSIGFGRLVLGWISEASADQRAGRAGRQAPGVCYRLWSPARQAGLRHRDTPEILRLDLAGAVLQLLAWGESVLHDFPWFEQPPDDALQKALDLLFLLGALESPGSPDAPVHLSPIGQKMAGLPLHPRLARLLISGRARSCAPLAALAAAVMSEPPVYHWDGQDHPYTAPGPSDLLDLMQAVCDAAGGRKNVTWAGCTVRRNACRGVIAEARRIMRLFGLRSQPDILAEMNPERAEIRQLEALLSALLDAFPDRLARRRKEAPERGVMVGTTGIRLARHSVVRQGRLFLALEIHSSGKRAQSEGTVRIASEVYLDWLPEHLLQERSSVNFDTRRKRVEFWTETLFFDLPVERVRQPDGDKLLAQAVLAKAALGDLEHALDLREKKLVRFLARLRCLRDWRPDLDIPAYDQQDWAGVLEQICPGKRSFAELRRVPLLPVVRDRLTWRQRQLLDELAPERWPLADGRSVRIQYQEGKPPVLAVRIQQLFGVTQTPCLAGGRVPIVVHLLAPNGRPQQVTQDLNSFWRNIYPRVRKELMHRYPKHAWPEDPFA